MISQILAKKSSKVLLALLAVVFLCSQSILATYAQSTEVRVVPDTLTVGTEGQPMPTTPFTVNITVTNVTDLYSWQVFVWYNPLVVNYSAGWLPSDHVFAGKTIVESGPFRESEPGIGVYVSYSCSLQGSVRGINTTGTVNLCRLNFTAVANGVTVLNISVPAVAPIEFETLLTRSPFNDFELIPITTYDSSVTVIPEFPILSMLLVAFVVSGVAMVFLKKRWLQELPTCKKV